MSKCEFGKDSVSYLGHIIFAGFVSVEQDKIAAIQNWPVPITVKQLRAFLGLAGYYRRFVARFASIAAPLTQLLRKDAFVWGANSDHSFDALKTALTNTPVLKLPNFSQKFVVQTDASSVGAGAILLQEGHPIAYFSKQLGPRMQLASAYSQEMWDIMEAIRKWRQYFLGVHFEVQTDHKSLGTLMDQVVQTPEQQLWVSKLQGYDFSISYRPGKENAPADALSRLPEIEFSAVVGHSKPVVAVLNALRDFIQQHDETKQLYMNIQQRFEQYLEHQLKGGLILFRSRIFIPTQSTLQHLLIEEYHSNPGEGHDGVKRTMAKLMRDFY